MDKERNKINLETTGLIIGFNALFFALFAWFLSLQFGNINQRLDELHADNREIRNQVYNHIPSQIKQLQDEARQRDQKIDNLQRDVSEINRKLDRLLTNNIS